MKYYPVLVKQFTNCSADFSIDQLTRDVFAEFARQLTSENCKRIIFDARQAAIFDKSGSIEEKRKEKIFPPFSKFYLELTEPIYLKRQEPGCHDVFWSLLYLGNYSKAIRVFDEGKRREVIDVNKVTFFFRSDDGEFVDRTWSVSAKGEPLVGRAPQKLKKRYPPTSKDGTAIGLIAEHLLPDYLQEGELMSVYELPRMEWWEESLLANTDLLYWMFAYMMAKSVKLVEIPISRQVRRACERRGEIPKPWHIVKLEPKRIISQTEYVGSSGRHHSIRYDVISHLRFSKHLLKDGTYKEMVEVVREHQRGLANAIYVPKTYQVNKGKALSSEQMEKYFKQ